MRKETEKKRIRNMLDRHFLYSRIELIENSLKLAKAAEFRGKTREWLTHFKNAEDLLKKCKEILKP